MHSYLLASTDAVIRTLQRTKTNNMASLRSPAVLPAEFVSTMRNQNKNFFLVIWNDTCHKEMIDFCL